MTEDAPLAVIAILADLGVAALTVNFFSQFSVAKIFDTWFFKLCSWSTVPRC